MNDDHGYRPTDCQVKRRDSLVYLLGQALGYSGEMALPAAAFQQVTRVAVDVTCGDATDADLRHAAESCLADLDHMVGAHPLRRALRTVMDEIADEHSGDAAAHLPEVDNQMHYEGDERRKERASGSG